MPRKRLADSPLNQLIAVRLEEKHQLQLQQIAKEENKSQSEVARFVLVSYLDAYEKPLAS
jgi:hypothetical protein